MFRVNLSVQSPCQLKVTYLYDRKRHLIALILITVYSVLKFLHRDFDVLLSVHLSIILVTDQLNAQILVL